LDWCAETAIAPSNSADNPASVARFIFVDRVLDFFSGRFVGAGVVGIASIGIFFFVSAGAMNVPHRGLLHS
jgi:hypothetical protein